MEKNMKEAKLFVIKSIIESIEQDARDLELAEKSEKTGVVTKVSKVSKIKFDGTYQDLIKAEKEVIDDIRGLLIEYKPKEEIEFSLSREQVLKKANECVNGQREQDYGSPEDNFQCIADLWTIYTGGQMVFTSVDVAMMMALLKIARIASGTGTDDSFVDLAGYAACGGELSELERKRKNKGGVIPVRLLDQLLAERK